MSKKVVVPNYSDQKVEIDNEYGLNINSPRISGGFGMLDYRNNFKSDDWTLTDWFSCRESFHYESNRIRRFLFGHKPSQGRNVAAFIHRIEEDLNLPRRCEFGPTQSVCVTWVKITPWWGDSNMRRSLFTIMLRQGRQYNLRGDNFEEALYSHEYTRETKYAVNRFLKGYTRYTGKINGWFTQFSETRTRGWGRFRYQNVDAKKVRELLIKP